MHKFMKAAAAVLALVVGSAPLSAQGPTQLSTGQVLGYFGAAPAAVAVPSFLNWYALTAVTPQSKGALCLGATDDRIGLQAAIAALPATGGVLYTPPGSACRSSVALSLAGKRNVKFLGASQKDSSLGAPSKWTFTGTGARFLDARDGFSIAIDGMEILYSSASFTGNLVDFSAATPGVSISAYLSVANSTLGPDTGRTGTATLVAASGTVDLTLDNNYFYHGAPSLLGQTAIGPNVRTTLRHNTFGFSDTVTISSCGEAWLVEGNSFEPTSSGQAQAFSNISAFPCKGGHWNANWFGDVTVDGGQWIDGFFQGTSFTNNQMAGPIGVVSAQGIKLNSSSGIVISGNRFELLSAAVNCVVSNEGVRFGPNRNVSVATQVANPSGCTGLNTDGNSPPVSQQGTGQIMIGQAGADPLPKTISGDLTLGATGTATLASIISAGGPTGSATVAPIITYDAKGRLTAVSSATIQPAIGNITGLGTGVATALAINIGSAGSPVTFNGALGTPSSGVATNLSGSTAAVDTSNTNLATNAFVINQSAAATPIAVTNTAAVGTSTRFARADHVHAYDNTAWSTYTPTISSTGGTLAATGTTMASVSGRYKQIGKTVVAQCAATVTVVGTASGSWFCTLPVTASGLDSYAGASIEGSITGRSGAAFINSAQPTLVSSRQADTTTYWTVNYRVVITITYEST